MKSSPGREVLVPLWVEVVSDCPDGRTVVACLRCRQPLEIHQPDAGLPDRMLATCPDCRSWHLIDCGAGGGGAALVALLPDIAPFREALAPPAAGPPGPPGR